MIPQFIMAVFLALIIGCAITRHGKKSSDGSTVNGIPALVLAVVQIVVLTWGGFWS